MRTWATNCNAFPLLLQAACNSKLGESTPKIPLSGGLSQAFLPSFLALQAKLPLTLSILLS